MAESKAVTRADSLPESKVDPAQALTATKSLLEYIKKTSEEETAKSGKRNLLANDDGDAEAGAGGGAGAAAETPIWLTISTKRHILDSDRLKPIKIAVPHALNTADDDTTICLITADPQRAYKDLVAASAFPADLRKRITRVVDVAHLMKKFKSYEAQRKLFAEHDIFLGDDRIINRLPKVLGKTFYKTTVKRPVPVILAKPRRRGDDGKRVKAPKKKKLAANGTTQLEAEDQAAAVAAATAAARSPEQIAAEIQKAIGAASVHLAPAASTSVKVGLAGWPAAHVAANAETVCRELVGKYVPQRWANVKAIFLKGPRTMAVPIWQTDELWLEGSKDVLKTGSEELKAFEARQAARREKANIGKKRKAVLDSGDAEEEKDNKTAAAVGKKGKAASKEASRPAKKAKQVPESNDSGLDKQIAASKDKLKKQKNAAKKAMDV